MVQLDLNTYDVEIEIDFISDNEIVLNFSSGLSVYQNGTKKVSNVKAIDFFDGTNTTAQVDSYNGRARVYINSTANGGGGGSGTVQSVTGSTVDNTDPNNPVINAQAPLGYTPENVVNKTNTVTGNESNSTKYLSVKGVYDWVIGLGYLLSSTAAITYQAIITASTWGNFIVALTGKTTPVDTDSIIISDSADSDDAKKLTWANIKATLATYFDGLYTAKNSAITGATKTKITYDAKGLVTSGSDATTADIADSTNKRYVTDAQLTVIGNTSGTNTGDNAVNILYSGLAASKQDVLVSGTNIKTINSNSLLGSGDIVINASSGGSDTQVQFNDGGSFGGDANFTFNKTTNRLTVDYVAVNDDAYDATTWNGNLDVPTKNAVRDKIESMTGITPEQEEMLELAYLRSMYNL